MTKPDPKPRKRIIDKQLMRRLHIEKSGLPCEVCGIERGTELDHIVSRAQGGDDVRENFRWTCSACHRLRHGGC